MQDWFIVCYYEDLSDREKKLIDDIFKMCSLWEDKYENEIKRLRNEIEWYQKQIDKISR